VPQVQNRLQRTTAQGLRVVFKSPCRNCDATGYVMEGPEGKQAKKKCPVCKGAKGIYNKELPVPRKQP
jgi:rubrerythrin